MSKHPSVISDRGQSDSNRDSQFDVLVVGAGASGLYSIYKLRQMGFRVHAFEAADGVGGTWYWNRYPGCRCDVESLEYSFSFSEELQQEWHWEDRFSTQQQILEYMNHVAQRFELLPHISFNTRVKSAHFDSQRSIWTLTTDAGDSYEAPFTIMATGNLSTPRVPDIAGLDTFEGDWYHTGYWPKQGVDFSGKKTAVIGTGSSGVQMIPVIAQQASQLTVFQRTANFILPARNGPLDVQVESEHKASYSERRKAAAFTPFGIAGYPAPTTSAVELDASQRDAIYEAKWQAGGTISYLYAFTDLLVNEASNETAAEFVRNKIRGIVDDPEVAELLCPDNHPIGTKRLVMDTNYFETYNLPHVELVDVRRAPIECFTPNGIRTAEADYQFDAIAIATGFDAMTGAMKEIEITTDSGADINQKWQDGPRTYLGLMVAGFPNLFMITGPQSPGVKSNMLFSIEQHTNWIIDCLSHLREQDCIEIEAQQSAEDAWVVHNNAVANSTLYPKANSWYMGANIPGKPRIFMPYVGGVESYVKKCEAVVANGYEGFNLTKSRRSKSA